MTTGFGLADMLELAEIKKKNPKEYNEILKGVKEVTRDLVKMMAEIAEEEIGKEPKKLVLG